jgi:hypothetical protein
VLYPLAERQGCNKLQARPCYTNLHISVTLSPSGL